MNTSGFKLIYFYQLPTFWYLKDSRTRQSLSLLLHVPWNRLSGNGCTTSQFSWVSSHVRSIHSPTELTWNTQKQTSPCFYGCWHCWCAGRAGSRCQQGAWRYRSMVCSKLVSQSEEVISRAKHLWLSLPFCSATRTNASFSFELQIPIASYGKLNKLFGQPSKTCLVPSQLPELSPGLSGTAALPKTRVHLMHMCLLEKMISKKKCTIYPDWETVKNAKFMLLNHYKNMSVLLGLPKRFFIEKYISCQSHL